MLNLKNREETRRRHRRHRDHLENLDEEKLVVGPDGKVIEYDEVISPDEKEDLHQLIEWMSVEQTLMMTCLAAMCLALFVICALKLCKAQAEEEMILGERDNLINRSSPVTFRNLARRVDQTVSKRTEKESKKEEGVPGSGSNRERKAYLYSDDTPSFTGKY